MITNARVLQQEFIPGEVKHRDAEVSHLSDTLRPLSTGDGRPTPSFLCGPSGAGKTCIARYTVNQLRENVVELNHQYVNCWENYSRFKTLYRILDGINQTIDIHRQSTPRDVGLDARLGGELLDEPLYRPRREPIARAGRKERLGVAPPVPEIPPEQSDGRRLELEGRRRGRTFLNPARQVHGPRLEIDVVDVERDELADPEAGVVQQRDYRLVAVLEVRRDGAGETDAPELVDLAGLQPGTGARLGVAAVVVCLNVGIAWGGCRGAHGFYTATGSGRRSGCERRGL